jgi:hypothetical protein
MSKYSNEANKKIVEEISLKLKENNIDAFIADSEAEAREKVLSLIPKGSRVLAGSSKTSEAIGLIAAIDESKDYISVRKEYMSFDHKNEEDKIRVTRSTPDYIVGSVQAVTKNGELIVVSNTGSQIVAYAGGAAKVILVIGAQKIVEDLNDGLKRVYEYVLPLESERLKKVYGVESYVSKILIINKEVVPQRLTVIFVNKSLGF